MDEKKRKKKDVVAFMKEAIGYVSEKTEDEEDAYIAEKGNCSHGMCDGSGFIPKRGENGTIVQKCECYYDELAKTKMKKANIEIKYHDADFEFKENVATTLLHPKKKVEERKFRGKKPATPKPEEPEDYIKRAYDKIEIKKGMSYFLHEYREKSLSFLNERPRKKVKNLLMMGDPGTGKTYGACALGKAYIKEGKNVYFTTMQKLVNDVINPDVDIRKVMGETDLVIIDELGSEYHTEKKWALTQIKDLFRVRYNSHLPIVATTNYYPNELMELYDKSLMSILNGTFFFMLMEADIDMRIEEADIALKDFSFHEE